MDDRELLKRVAEAVQGACHDQCGCHENLDLDAIIDRVVGEQGEVAEIRHALEGARREAEAQQPEADSCDAVTSALPEVRCRLPFGHDVHKGNGQHWIAAAGYDELAAAHARGVAEERERVRRVLLSLATETGNAWNGALSMAWEKINRAAQAERGKE